MNESSFTPDVVSYLRSQGITRLYHFTDRSNIQSIIDNGGLYSWRACENKGISIKRPGGSDTSRSLDSFRGLDNYVRLSFTRNHPMMYVAQNDGRISSPVVLEINLTVAGRPGTKFSDRNATKNGAVIATGYDGARNIHFNTVKQSNHFDLPTFEKEFYQAEVLVLEKVPLSYITNIDLYKPKPQTTPKTSTGSSSGYGTSNGYGTGGGYSYRPTYSSSSNSSTSNSSSGGNGCLAIIIIFAIFALLGLIMG